MSRNRVIARALLRHRARRKNRLTESIELPGEFAIALRVLLAFVPRPEKHARKPERVYLTEAAKVYIGERFEREFGCSIGDFCAKRAGIQIDGESPEVLATLRELGLVLGK